MQINKIYIFNEKGQLPFHFIKSAILFVRNLLTETLENTKQISNVS